MMTHTCPIDYLPTEMFMSTRQNAAIKRKPSKSKSKKLFKPDIDRSTEEWLGKLEKKLDYEVWYCGHYHIDKQIDKINMMCHEIRP
jgi:3-oxoacid CoA-transferase subunit A